MRLGIDISQIVYEGTGVGRFTAGLTEAILRYDRHNEWYFFFSSLRRRLPLTLIKRIQKKHHFLVWPLPPTLLAYLWNDLHSISKFSKVYPHKLTQLDWFITSDWTEPPLPVPKATIVHDLVFLRYPETTTSKIRITQLKRLNWVKTESRLIFTDSQTTKTDCINYLSFPKQKIVVNYPGVEIDPTPNEKSLNILKKYHLKNQFILTVGKIEPRKNLPRLIAAFQKVSTDINLVIVGPAGWGDLDITSDPRIKYLGYLQDEELAALYQQALFFIFPSLWEGFGYPAVEAMKLGCPISLANTSSLREIGAGVADFFEPSSTSSIEKSIKRLLYDNKLRTEISRKGKSKSQLYSWKNYYEILITSLAKTINLP